MSRRIYHGFGRLSLSAVIAATLWTAQAHAANRFWVDAGSGSHVFSDTLNWSTTSGGASGASVPGIADTANFTLNNTYNVFFGFGNDTTNTDLDIDTGTVTLQLSAVVYTLTSTSAVEIGGPDLTGRLTLSNGTLAVDTAGDDVLVGAQNGSTGFLTIGADAQLGQPATRAQLIVGRFGPGTLTVNGNGGAYLTNMTVGLSIESPGVATVSGPLAFLDLNSYVEVGNGGTASLTLSGGATLTSTSFSSIASGTSGVGTVNITGAGTSWTQTGVITVADLGQATLNIQSGGTMTTGQAAIGDNAGSFGTATVNGTSSQWTINGTLGIGNLGEGVLNVTNGGRVSTTGSMFFGNGAGRGGVTVTGAGAQLDAGGSISVGGVGPGTLVVSGGGRVTSTSGVLGQFNTAAGEATISGIGSLWTLTSGSLNVAGSGSGTLTVADGGSLTVPSTLTVGDPAGAPIGRFNFHGGTVSTGGFTRAGNAVVDWTDGTLAVHQGTYNNFGVALTINGADADDQPTLQLASGSMTTPAQLGVLIVGNNRRGALEVTGGSSLQVPGLSIGAADGGNGQVTVAGNNTSLSSMGDLNVGGTASAGGGAGTLNIETGATVSTAALGQLRLWAGSTLNVNGGTLLYGTITPNGGKVNFNAGRIEQLNALAADELTLTALLGPTHEMGAGRTLATSGAAMLSSYLVLSGGRLQGSTLAVSSPAGTSTIVQINNGGVGQFTSGVQLNADTRTYVEDGGNLNVGTTLNQSGELHLAGTGRISGTQAHNLGVIAGSGRVDAQLDNGTFGQVRIGVGEHLTFNSPSTHNNNGLIEVTGGTLEFTDGSVTNSTSSPSTGLIAVRNGTLRFADSINNNGSMTFTAGVNDVFGNVMLNNILSTPGRIVVSAGAQVNFYDDVANGGSIQVSAAGASVSTAVFLGLLVGNGVSGGGQVFLEGDVRPGFSPGTMAFGGNVSLGPLAELQIEIGGNTPGTQYDRVTVAQTLAVGGILDVDLINAFHPSAGSSFEIVSAAGGLSGTFAFEALPQVGGGLFFDVLYAASAVNLVVGGVVGDYNRNGTVDAADYTVWRNSLGQSGQGLAADGNFDGAVTPLDYAIWKTHFGETAPASGTGATAAVPEPATWVLLILVSIGVSFVRRLRFVRR